jgi:hypothetical protein
MTPKESGLAGEDGEAVITKAGNLNETGVRAKLDYAAG